MTRVHILAIHGIGRGPREGFSRDLRNLVVQELEHMGSGSASRAEERRGHFWQEVVWDEDKAAEELYQKVGDPLPRCIRQLLRRLEAPTPREFACYDVGDILDYYSRQRQVLDKVQEKVERIKEEHREKGTRELYFALVGHSMGSVVAFDFLHRSQREPGPSGGWLGADSRPGSIQVGAASDVTVLASGLFTLGSPLALFSRLRDARAHQYRQGEPFRLVDGWWNFYDKEDLVAFPLQGIFSAMVQDVEVDNFPLPVIGFLRAHGGYWRNRNVAKCIAQHVHRMEAGEH